MTIQLHPNAFDPWQELVAYQNTQVRGMGATAVFVGTMRDINEGDEVTAMYLEHYPGMTEQALRQLADDAMQRSQILDILIQHRTGDILPGDPIVLVAVWSEHRKAAFETCRDVMEQLKSTVPFWKREILNNGTARWVSKNTSGY